MCVEAHGAGRAWTACAIVIATNTLQRAAVAVARRTHTKILIVVLEASVVQQLANPVVVHTFSTQYFANKNYFFSNLTKFNNLVLICVLDVELEWAAVRAHLLASHVHALDSVVGLAHA